MSTKHKRRELNEQLQYMRDLYDLLCLKESGDSALRYMEHRGLDKSPGSRRDSFEDYRARHIKETKRLVKELGDRVAGFEKKMATDPGRYPLGRFSLDNGLNDFERFVVAASSAIAVHDGEAGLDLRDIDTRLIARHFERSPSRRLDAELYFTGDCKLVKAGIIELEDGGRHPLAKVKGGRRVTISPSAYMAILGRPESSEGERHTGLGLRSRGKAPGLLLAPEVRLKRVALPGAVRREIETCIAFAQNRELVLGNWGLGRQVTKGTSTSMLFAGPPGTGKTMAAEAVAFELDMKMLLVRGSDIVSMWHGETERNAAAVFKHAGAEGALLLFDEADSFFYSRHGAASSTDQCSNRTVNIFLGCLEAHELPVILTTNRAEALDPALERRISIKVLFEPPGEVERRRIWQLHLPGKMPLAQDVDRKQLARGYRLTGGQIKNAVMAASRKAVYRSLADESDVLVTMADLEEACHREIAGSRVFGNAEREIGFKAQ